MYCRVFWPCLVSGGLDTSPFLASVVDRRPGWPPRRTLLVVVVAVVVVQLSECWRIWWVVVVVVVVVVVQPSAVMFGCSGVLVWSVLAVT